MRYVLLLCPFLLSGCLAAGAGAIGGAAVTEGNHIEYYLLVNEVKPAIAKALRKGELREGMTLAQVRLVMDAKKEYDPFPFSRYDVESGSKWIYKHQGSAFRPKKIVIRFEDGVATSIEQREPDPLIDIFD